MENGYIKLYKKIKDWEWYKNTVVFRVFIHCLLKAYWKDTKIEGKIIPRGSFITSYQKLAEELSDKKQKIGIQSIRTALKHLVSTHELTIKTTSKNTVITVNNYELYQESNTETNNQLTNNQHTTNTQLTTNEEYKEYKNNNVCNSIYTCEDNICHFKLDYKMEACFDCMKKNICKNETSPEFQLRHNKTFEQWSKERLEALQEINQSLSSMTNNTIPPELEDYDYLQEKNIIEGENNEINNT